MSDDSPTVPNYAELWRNWIIDVAETHPFFRLFPLNYEEMWKALTMVSTDLLLNPVRAQSAWLELAEKQYDLMVQTGRQALGLESRPVVPIDPRDRRFKDEAWSEQALFNAIRQSYLVSSGWLLAQAEQIEWLSEPARRRVQFYLRQFVDAVSPSNFLLTNPVVLRETVESGGENLLRGMRHLLEDLHAGHVTMVDDRPFELGRTTATTPGQIVLRTPLIELIQYAPSTSRVHARPLLIIPPWINKYYVLDLRPENSLVKYLVDQGYTVFVVSWKNADSSMDAVGMEEYLTLGVLPAMEAVTSISGSPDVNAVGYCLGGTLLAIALAALKARGDARLKAATFFVALQDFEEPGDLGVFIDEAQVSQIEERMARYGYLDSRDMAAAFNLLRANDLIWSYVVNNYLLGKEPPAFDLLYWNSDGTRMPRAMHSYYLRNMYLENNLVKPNCLTLLDEPLDLGRIDNQIYAVGTLEDHIVPWRSAFRLRHHIRGPVRFILANSGHIAGIINPPGGKGVYYTNASSETDPDAWLAAAEPHTGSWWEDWVAWLKPRSGKRVAPPPLGNEQYPPLEPAPGSYVRE